MFRNTVAQTLQLFVTTAFSFLLAPIMLSQLGLSLFGVWAIVGAVALYATLLDAGIARSLSRFVALYEARGDQRKIQECIGLGLIAVTIVGLLLLPITWFGAPLLTAAIDHELSVHDTRLVLLGSAAIFVAQGYTGVLVALPHGLQQMMPPNIATMIGSALNFLFSVIALFSTRSLITYAWANALADALTIGLVIVAVRGVWKHRIAAVPSRALVKEVLGFSVRVQMNWVADLINMSAGRIVIGVLVSVEAAGAYQLGSSVALGLRSLGVVTISAMIPTATNRIAQGAHTAARKLFRRYAPLSLGLSLPIFVLGALSAPFLLMAWLGERPPDTAMVLIVLSLTYAANVATGVATTLWIADGHPGLVSTNAIVAAGLNIALAIALAPLFGLAGVMAATAFAIVSMSVVLIVRFMRFYRLTALDARRAFGPPVLLSVGLALPLVPFVVLTADLAHTRLQGLVLLTAVSLAYGLPYWLLAGRAGLIPDRLLLPRLLRWRPHASGYRSQ